MSMALCTVFFVFLRLVVVTVLAAVFNWALDLHSELFDSFSQLWFLE